ncbi:MAG: hypothetical protein AB1758_10460 [Candidatus Eremiobacterota bacterium]
MFLQRLSHSVMRLTAGGWPWKIPRWRRGHSVRVLYVHVHWLDVSTQEADRF